MIALIQHRRLVVLQQTSPFTVIWPSYRETEAERLVKTKNWRKSVFIKIHENGEVAKKRAEKVIEQTQEKHDVLCVVVTVCNRWKTLISTSQCKKICALFVHRSTCCITWLVFKPCLVTCLFVWLALNQMIGSDFNLTVCQRFCYLPQLKQYIFEQLNNWQRKKFKFLFSVERGAKKCSSCIQKPISIHCFFLCLHTFA